MKKKNGFTLVEVIAVIIIIGILMLIAVPNVTNYILGSRRSSYASDIHAYIETIRSEYEMREYGPLLDDDEIMIVPIKNVILEKGDAGRSPFGAYVYDKSYIVIVTEKGGYQFYANVVDETNLGVIMTPYSILDRKSLVDDATSIRSWSTYYETENLFTYNSQDYKWCETRSVKGKTVEEAPILLLCKE